MNRRIVRAFVSQDLRTLEREKSMRTPGARIRAANKSLLSRLIKLIVNNYPDFLRTPECHEPLSSVLSSTPGDPIAGPVAV